MAARGRQPFIAAVSGEIDWVPFTNYFKYMATAMRNAAENRNFVLTDMRNGHKYSYLPSKDDWIPLSPDAPPLRT